MSDGLMLQASLEDKLAECEEAIAGMQTDGRAMAKARSAYRVALAREELRLRLEEKLPASMVADVARGAEEVARLKYLLEAAEVAYAASREAVMLRKREADAIREQLQREWTQAGWR